MANKPRPIKLTAFVVRALRILLNYEEEMRPRIPMAFKGITCREFAKRCWPDSPNWHQPRKCGNGSTRGSRVWQKAGQELERLEKSGLVMSKETGYVKQYRLSIDGKSELSICEKHG